MTQIDTICRRLRDIGIFLLGVAAVGMTAYHIYVRTCSPESRMQRAIQETFARSFEKSLAELPRK
jgi:hypothetical protein